MVEGYTIISKEVTEKRYFVVLPDGIELEEDLFESLLDSNLISGCTLIHNEELLKKLEEAGWINTSSRGGSYSSVKLKNLKEKNK